MSLPAALERYVQNRTRSAAYLTFAAVPGGSSQLGGGAVVDRWPVCTGCGRPLYHLLTLDLTVAPQPLPAPGLAFFYCLSCAPSDHRDCGWHAGFSTGGVYQPQPPVPDQSEQPGPLVLLTDQAAGLAEVRMGADWPGTFDPALRRRLIKAGEAAPAPSRSGADRLLRLSLREPNGEVIDLQIGLTPATNVDEFVKVMTANRTIVSMSVEPLMDPTDYFSPYRDRLSELRGGMVVSKIGGWQDGWQEPRFHRCSCGGSLEHVATIASDGVCPFVVGDSGALYFMGCSKPGCGEELFWWLDYT